MEKTCFSYMNEYCDAGGTTGTHRRQACCEGTAERESERTLEGLKG